MATISQLEQEIISLENRLKLLTKDRSIGEEEMTRKKKPVASQNNVPPHANRHQKRQ